MEADEKLMAREATLLQSTIDSVLAHLMSCRGHRNQSTLYLRLKDTETDPATLL
jgi:hypothetical protein